MNGRREPATEDDLVANAVIGAAIEVHRALGPGFLESVYERALALELQHRGLSFARQAAYTVRYRGVDVGCHRMDFVVAGRLIVELKATETGISSAHVIQALSYLRASALELALIINFNQPLLRDGIRRVIRPRPKDE